MSQALAIVADEVVLSRVTEYRYCMDGQLTGYLYLSEGASGTVRSWFSMETRLRTIWHGEWIVREDGSKFVEFDCRGKESNNREWKWAEVNAGGDGYEYRGRRISMQAKRVWYFGPINGPHNVGS